MGASEILLQEKFLLLLARGSRDLSLGRDCVGELGRWEGGGSGSGGLFDTATEHVREEGVGHGTGALLSGDMLCSIEHLGQIPQLNIVDCLRDRNRRVLCWEKGRKQEAHRVSGVSLVGGTFFFFWISFL